MHVLHAETKTNCRLSIIAKPPTVVRPQSISKKSGVQAKVFSAAQASGGLCFETTQSQRGPPPKKKKKPNGDETRNGVTSSNLGTGAEAHTARTAKVVVAKKTQAGALKAKTVKTASKQDVLANKKTKNPKKEAPTKSKATAPRKKLQAKPTSNARVMKNDSKRK